MSDVLDERTLAGLLQMVGDDPDFVDELADAYLADVPVQMAALRDALDRGNAADLVRPAHTLKGASLTLGGVRVAELARQLEERARAGTLDGAAVLVAALEEAKAALEAPLAEARARRWRPA